MSQDYCRGCGTVIQTVDPVAPGYVPETVLQQKKQLICQRCYKINHYGEAGHIQPDHNQIRHNLQRAINNSALAILVVDFSDLTGSFAVWQNYLQKTPYILAVNKIDLLPTRTKEEEVTDFLKEYINKLKLPQPIAIVSISSLKGYGVESLTKKITALVPEKSKVALFGVTNVGKSSLVKRILQTENVVNSPTVSKFPGTTLGLSNWSILDGRITLIDTPGLVPGDRMGDLLCPKCGSLLAANRIEQKLWGIKPGKGIIIGGLGGVINRGDAEITLIAFTAADVGTHRTDAVRVTELLEAQPDWLKKVCLGCIQKIKWQTHEVQLDPNQDLAIAGLGWVSLRRERSKLQMLIPEGIRWEIRAAVVGRK
ncbi:MAG TPA: 50S ribosome-binding GTPase [Bacillota bacterium]|jgi:ribosome biogenesis GTPase A|nr:50S ribosome-binding GTPase [Bacillota bacterium]HOL10653.1 50S ribosome-binding GTPase [Bacillota bacterium]HPO98056.1 50S ribosome-binding GTPase [Bacillota bacterium]